MRRSVRKPTASNRCVGVSAGGRVYRETSVVVPPLRAYQLGLVLVQVQVPGTCTFQAWFYPARLESPQCMDDCSEYAPGEGCLWPRPWTNLWQPTLGGADDQSVRLELLWQSGSELMSVVCECHAHSLMYKVWMAGRGKGQAKARNSVSVGDGSPGTSTCGSGTWTGGVGGVAQVSMSMLAPPSTRLCACS